MCDCGDECGTVLISPIVENLKLLIPTVKKEAIRLFGFDDYVYMSVMLNGADISVRIIAESYTLYVAGFKISPFPGLPCRVVSWDVNVAVPFRGKGFGEFLLSVREVALEKAGIGGVLAAVLKDNKQEQHLLTKHEWKNLGGIGDSDFWEKRFV